MKYLNEILWLAAWPVIIWVTFKICFWVIRRYEAKTKSQPE